MTELRERREPDIRNRLAIALDVDDLVEASRIAREVRPWFGVAKIGLVLYAASGPDAVMELMASGYRVMLDLKLHDIPSHVRKAAQVLGGLGVSYLTLHASGGASMLRGGVEGLAEGAAMAGLEPPAALAVTVLTSDAGAPSHVLGNRVRAAVEGGCHGIVCAASDVREAKQLAPRIITVVPGIRLPGTSTDDQARASAPHAAVEAGADLLVVGRAVTAAADWAKAASEVVGSLNLERRRSGEDASAPADRSGP